MIWLYLNDKKNVYLKIRSSGSRSIKTSFFTLIKSKKEKQRQNLFHKTSFVNYTWTLKAAAKEFQFCENWKFDLYTYIFYSHWHSHHMVIHMCKMSFIYVFSFFQKIYIMCVSVCRIQSCKSLDKSCKCLYESILFFLQNI